MTPAASSPALVGTDHLSLEQRCHAFLVHGLAPSSRKTAQRKFFNLSLLFFKYFLGQLHPSGSPCPTDEWILCLFATFLARFGHHSTIRNCLLLQRVVRGIKRSQGSPSSNRLPITDIRMLFIWKSLNARIIACFGRHARWGTLVSSALPSLQCLIWPPSLLQFTDNPDLTVV